MELEFSGLVVNNRNLTWIFLISRIIIKLK